MSTIYFKCNRLQSFFTVMGKCLSPSDPLWPEYARDCDRL